MDKKTSREIREKLGMSHKKIREIRENLGLTQEKMARILDISYATVNRVETGKSYYHEKTVKKFEQLDELMKNPKMKSDEAKKKLGEAIYKNGLTAVLKEAIDAGLIVVSSVEPSVGIIGYLFGLGCVGGYLKEPKKDEKTPSKK